MKLLTIDCSLGEDCYAQMLESAHRLSEQTPWPRDKREQPHAFIRALMRPADSYFCAKNTRTKHDMVKDAKVGEIPSFRSK